MAGDISLTSGMRTNLLQLQDTAKLMDRTQARISTGKRVNTALDGPAAFFAAKALTDRAGDLAALKDGMGQSISTIKAADKAITSITSLVQQMKGITASAKAATGSANATTRANYAAQYNDLRAQINNLVEDATYAGKNLLLGTGVAYAATAASITGVDALGGIDNTAVDNIGGGTSTSNITVALSGAVEQVASSVTAAQTSLGISAVTLANFKSADSVAFTVTQNTSDNVTLWKVNNTDSTAWANVEDSSNGTDARTLYLASNASVSQVESDLNISNLTIKNIQSTASITLATSNITSNTATDFTVTQTGYTDIAADQSMSDTDTAATKSHYLLATASNTQLTTDTTLESLSISGAFTSDVKQLYFDNTNSSLTVSAILADGSSTDSVIGASTGAVSFSLYGATISFNDTINAGAADSTRTYDLTTITYTAAGTDAAGGATINSTGSAMSVASVTFTAGDIDQHTASGVVSGSTATVAQQDNRKITVTQNGTSVVRAAVPTGSERTLTYGATNTFVMDSGAAVSFSVKQSQFATGSATLAAYTASAATTTNNMSVQFNEDNSNSITVTSKDATTTGIKIAAAANSWLDQSDIDTAVTQLNAALTSLRTISSDLSANLGVVQTRETFTDNFINVLNEGSDKLTLADGNEEGANMLMLQTRQQLGTISLSMASQSAQSILRLFG